MQFLINPDRMNRRISELENIEGELGSIASGLEDIIGTNAVQMDSYNQVKRALRNYQQNVRILSENTAQMGAGLQSALSEYKIHEQNIVENASRKGLKPSMNKPPLIPGLLLPWSVLFPSGFLTLPTIIPGMGEISGSIWKGYDDSSDGKFSWSFFGDKFSSHKSVNGIDIGADGNYHIGHFKASGKIGSEWDDEKGNFKAEAKGEAGFSAIDGKISANVGPLKGTLEGSLVNAGVEGAIGLSLFSDGKFEPSVFAKASGKVNVAEGKVSGQFGTDEFNHHVEAKGSFMEAKGEVKFQAGKIKDEKGNVKYGVSAKAGGEAYVAEGSVSGGFTLFGIKFDASVSGKIGGGGASAGGEATSNGVEGEVGLGLGLGLGLKVKVDWSGFKWPSFKLPW